MSGHVIRLQFDGGVTASKVKAVCGWESAERENNRVKAVCVCGWESAERENNREGRTFCRAAGFAHSKANAGQ